MSYKTWKTTQRLEALGFTIEPVNPYTFLITKGKETCEMVSYATGLFDFLAAYESGLKGTIDVRVLLNST